MHSITNARLKWLFALAALVAIQLVVFLGMLWQPRSMHGANSLPTVTPSPLPTALKPLRANSSWPTGLPSSADNQAMVAAGQPRLGLRDAAPGEIWLGSPDLGVSPAGMTGAARNLSTTPSFFGVPSYQITYSLASYGYDADGNLNQGWSLEEANDISRFLDRMFPVLYDLYGPPSVPYTVTLLRDLRFTASAVFYPTLDEIHLGDTASRQLITHELIHAWRNDRILSSDANWQYEPTLSCFEEAFAHGGTYDAMTEFARRYPEFGLSQSLYQSSTEWDYDFQNVPTLRTRDFWSQNGGTQLHWIRYEMAAAAINKIQRQHPGFYRAFNAEYYARLNADPTLTSSRTLVKQIIQKVAPSIEGWPAAQWIDRQAIFACSDQPGYKVWVYTQPYPYDEYFIFQRIHLYETFGNGSDWAWHDDAQWHYHQLNGALGEGRVKDWQGNVLWQRPLQISPTANPTEWMGYGSADLNLTTQASHLPWPGGDANSYMTSINTLGLYNLEITFPVNNQPVTTNLPRVLGAELRQGRGVWGGVIGGNGGHIYLNHRDFPAEAGLALVNNAFWGPRTWASLSEDGLLNSRPGLIDVTYIDVDGNTYRDTRTIQWGSWNGNQAFLFDVATMKLIGGPALTPTPTSTATVTPTQPVPTVTATPSPTATTTPTLPQAQVIIRLDTQPATRANYQFLGNLGTFYLDDPAYDDGDAYKNQRTFVVPAGQYTVSQLLPSTWFITAITCQTNGNGTTSIDKVGATITVQRGAIVTCTFVNQRGVTLQTRKYHDQNRSGTRQISERYLPGWEISTHGLASSKVITQVTNEFGKANFNYLYPQSYKICETNQNGWSNIRPKLIDPLLQKPCFTLALQPGQIATMYFANDDVNVRMPEGNGEVQGVDEESIVVVDWQDGDVEDDPYLDMSNFVDVDLETPEANRSIYLPLIQQE